MRIFLTGATGFIGRRVAERLRARGAEVVALVRTPVEGGAAARAGLRDRRGRPGRRGGDRARDRGGDAVIHNGADYRVGIPKRERAALFDANVGGTQRVLDGVKIRMTDAKARSEPGYAPRGLDAGLRETLSA